MALKSKYTKKEDIPEGLEEHYLERDGAWELQAEGMKTTDDVERVKRDLTKEREAHKTTKEKVRPILSMLDGDKITMEVLVDRLDNYEALEASAQNAGDVDKQVDAKIAVREKQFKRELDAVTSDRDKYKTEYEVLAEKTRSNTILSGLQKAAMEAGVDLKSMEDVLMYSGKFTLDDNENVVTKEDGLTPKLWLDDQKERKNWWGPAMGAGATGGGGEAGSDNPFKGDNKTLQAQFRVKFGDEKAKAMAARAGKDLFGRPLPK